MRVEVKYTQFSQSADIELYALEKIGSIARFLKSFEKNGEIIVFVEIGRTTRHHEKGNIYYAEAMFETVPGGKKIRAADKQPDIRLAIDNVKGKLKKEIRRYKDKLEERHRK